jgi:hypothetical protein
MKRLAIAGALALAAGAAVLPTVSAHALTGTTGSGTTSEVNRTVAAARRATAKYHDVQAAVADGYAQVTGCVALPGVGGMGVHFLNRALAADPAIVADRPEELLYAPGPDGALELVGVEYFRADADQDPSTDGDRPSLDGIPFDGPMAGHAPGMPVHYDLHVWAWRANPAGTFEEWNPHVHC